MDSNAIDSTRLDKLVEELSPCHNCPMANTVRFVNLPGQRAIVDVLERIIALLFPGCHGTNPVADDDSAGKTVREKLRAIYDDLTSQCHRAFAYDCRKSTCDNCGQCRRRGQEAATNLLDALPEIRHMLEEDISAAYEGDPAAHSTMEIVMSYPGLLAIAVHRVAHNLYASGVPLVPRVMSEYAHSRTGIDIHPGARIGHGFFIDHGTGVVIGETCVIGSRVKLYQGVTLGARSFAKDSNGNPVKGIKRHPDVEDNVIIYAGATILGGDTVIGRDSVIGANVWLTHSIPAGSKVYNNEPEPNVVSHKKENH